SRRQRGQVVRGLPGTSAVVAGSHKPYSHEDGETKGSRTSRSRRPVDLNPPEALNMLIFDAHLDLAWNAIDWNRDLRLPVAEIRRREQGMEGKGRGCNTVSFPELRRGKVAIFIATLLARLLRVGSIPMIQRYASMEAAYAAAHGQLA